MSKPKNMTSQQESMWLSKERERQRNRPKRNRKPDPNASKRYAKWRAKNQILANKRSKECRLKKYEEYKAKEKETGKKNRALLKDCYVAHRLAVPVGTLRKYPDLLESHRLVLRLKRKFSKQTQL